MVQRLKHESDLQDCPADTVLDVARQYFTDFSLKSHLQNMADPLLQERLLPSWHAEPARSLPHGIDPDAAHAHRVAIDPSNGVFDYVFAPDGNLATEFVAMEEVLSESSADRSKGLPERHMASLGVMGIISYNM